jgi:hypothetical protein
VKRLELSRNGVHIRILRVGHGGIVLRFETAIPVVACGLDQDFLLVVKCGFFFSLPYSFSDCLRIDSHLGLAYGELGWT